MKLNLDKHFPNKEIAEQGVWKEVLPSIQFKIASASPSNSKFKALQLSMALETLPKKIKIDSKVTDKQVSEAYLKDTEALYNLENKEKELYALTILKGWKGVLKEDNTDLPFSEENALLILNQYPDLFQKIKSFATDDSLFKIQSEKEKEVVKKK